MIPSKAKPQVEGSFSHNTATHGKHLRRCIVTGASLPRSQLLRFVIDRSKQLICDVQERLPGRGVWVTCSSQAVAYAVQKKLFQKAAKQRLLLPEGHTFEEQVEDLLKQHCLKQLALAKKSGQPLIGHDRMRALLPREHAGFTHTYEVSSEPFKPSHELSFHKLQRAIARLECYQTHTLFKD